MLSAAISLAAAAAPALATVPIVTCASDGQLGPQPAPAPSAVAIRVPADAAPALAFYASEEGPNLLAPRGWACKGLSGSDGSVLFVAPDAATIEKIIARPGTYDGPAVIGRFNLGATSGRYEVWEGIARYFPAYRRVIDRPLWEEIMSAPLPDAPFAADIVHARADRTISLTTPANSEGQGTKDYLAKGAAPIDGWIRLLGSDDESALVTIDVRLPPEIAPLAPTILDSDRFAR